MKFQRSSEYFSAPELNLCVLVLFERYLMQISFVILQKTLANIGSTLQNHLRFGYAYDFIYN